METEELKYQDIAAQLALFNMLKINLACCPDVYKTLLAVLSDFDPNKPNSKNKTCQYVRLLISDKILADCVIVSLPQSDRERLLLQPGNSSLKNGSYIRKKDLLTLDKQSQTKDLDAIEEPENSITIIVTDQKDPPAPRRSSVDKASSLLTGSKQFTSAPKKGKLHKSDQPTVVKVVPNLKNKIDAENSTKHPNIKIMQTTSSKSSSIIQTISPSLSTIKSTSSVAKTTFINPGLKPNENLKMIRPKLVLPVPIQGISPALLSLPFASISSDINPNLINDSTVTSSPMIKASQCLQEFGDHVSDGKISTPSSYPICLTKNSIGNFMHQALPMERQYDQKVDKKVVGVPAVSSDSIIKVSNNMKRFAPLPVVEEPVRKKRLLSASGNQENAINNPGNVLGYQQKIDKPSTIDLTGSLQKSNCIEPKERHVTCVQSSVQCYMQVLSNTIMNSSCKIVNSSKNNAMEPNHYASTSITERGDTSSKTLVTYTEMSKNMKQPSVFIPTTKISPSTCVTSAKEYHLSYPLKRRRGITDSNIVPSSSITSNLPHNYLTNMGEEAKFIATPVSNTIYCGLPGSRSFPYRQHIHFSQSSSSAHEFPSSYIENSSSACQSNRIVMDAPNDLITDSLVDDNNDIFGIVQHESARCVKDQTQELFDKSCEMANYQRLDNKKSDRLNHPSECLTKEDQPATESHTKNKQTFLIIETKTSTGSDQVQISLNPQTSGNLIGELLKLKPGLGLKQCFTQQSEDADNIGNKLEIPKHDIEDTVSHTVTNVDEFLNFEDKTTLSDISNDGSSNSEEFHCSDGQYGFSDQSDIIPIQIDNCPGKPKVVSFPMLNQASLTSDRLENRESATSTSNMAGSESRTNISTPVFPTISTKYSDPAISDSMSSSQTGDSDSGSSQFRFSSYGMSPYLMRFISDINSNPYEDDLSDLEGSDTVFSSNELEEM